LIRKSIIFLCSVGLLCFLASCGKKGDPVPYRPAVPGAIGDLTGDVRDGVLFLSFTIPTKNKDGSDLVNLRGFKVLKRCASCGGGFEQFRIIRLSDDRGFTIVNGRLYLYDDDLADQYRYDYRVHTILEDGSSGDASNVFPIKWQTPPTKPAGDVTVTVNDRKIELSWKSEEGFSYNVYRFDDGTYPLFPANQAALKKPFFVDTGLKNGKTYVYEIRKLSEKDGVKWEGEGLRVEGTPKDLTPPSVPQGVKAEKRGSVVRVFWLAVPEKDLAGYYVYRIVEGKPVRITGTPVEETAFFDHDVAQFRFLSYYVTSVDHSGNESEPSRETIILLKE
jgi:hypothetical protein